MEAHRSEVMSDAAVASIVTGIVTMTTIVVGFLTLWVKLRYGEAKVAAVEEKIDANTEMTKTGNANSKAAAVAAKVAVQKAGDVSEDNRRKYVLLNKIDQQTNGGLIAAIDASLKPLSDAFKDHVIQDEQNMGEIRKQLESIHNKIKADPNEQ
jgi:hypothetical protein